MVKLFQSFQKWLPLMVGYDILAKSGIKASNSMQRYACQLTHQAGYFTFFVGLSLAIGFLTCEATKLQEYSDNFYIFSSLLLNAFFYISIKYKTDTIINLVKRFERIVDERLIIPTKHEMYVTACEFVEKTADFVFLGSMNVSLPFATLPYVFFSYSMYFIMDMGRDAFMLPFIMWSIFDWKTPFGYIFAFSFESMGAAYIMLTCACLMSQGFSSCWLFIAFADDLRLLDDLVGVYKLMFTAEVTFVSVTLAVTLLIFQLEITEAHLSIPAVLKALIMVLWALVPMFVICSGFEEITVRFDTIDIYQECNWYRFLPKVQRMLPFVIANLQESTRFVGYANITCTRDTFKRVTHNGYSTFMIIRNLVK